MQIYWDYPMILVGNICLEYRKDCQYGVSYNEVEQMNVIQFLLAHHHKYEPTNHAKGEELYLQVHAKN